MSELAITADSGAAMRRAELARDPGLRGDGRALGSRPPSRSSRAAAASRSPARGAAPTVQPARGCRPAPAMSATQVRQISADSAVAINAVDPGRRRRQSGRRAVPARQWQRGRPGALARLPDRRHLLRGGDRADSTASARSPRWCSTASATRLIRTRSAASSSKARARLDRLPVQLHLRRLAAPGADAGLLGSARAPSPRRR